MATHTGELDVYASSLDRRPGGLREAQQAYGLLYAAFIVAPIVAGLDKFAHLLVDWTQFSRRPLPPDCR